METNLENNPQDLIRVKNPTNRNFKFYWDSLPHEIEAGAEATYPRWLALHYCKKLIVAIINSKIEKVKVGDSYTDSLRTSDPAIQRKLAPYILLYVVQRFAPPPKVEKQVTAKSEQKLEDYEVSDTERHVDTKFELPEVSTDITEDIFLPTGEDALSKPAEASTAGDTPQVEAEPAPKDDILPEATKKPKRRTHQELANEARALGLELMASETDEALEKRILEQAGA
jgi:hypothetical protein